jgi:DNA invertase Pin-like site-specific DNA recombinase
MKFAIWAAVSTESQASEDKASLPHQEENCRRVALAKGWHDTGLTYVVAGQSRTRYVNLRDAENEIPPLHRALEEAKRGLYDILILYDFNRMRDLLDPVSKTLAAYGVQMYSVNQPVDPLPQEEFHPYASDSDSMVRGMSQIISRWQVSDLRRKYLYGVSARVRSGLPSLRIPYGYRKPAGQEMDRRAVPVIHPPEARIVEEIKSQFLSGVSYYDICDWLNSRSIPTPQGGKGWSHSVIKRIVTNPFYAGRVSFQRNRLVRDPNSPDRPRVKRNQAPSIMAEGKHKALWSWEDHQALLVEHDRRIGTPRNRRYAFSGLLVCSVCGARLVHDHGVWRCKQKDGPLKDHIGMSMAESLAIIPRALQKALYNVDPAAPSRRETVMVGDVGDLERQRRRVQAAYESEVYSLEEAEEKIKAIDAQIKERKDGELSRLRKIKERESFRLTLDQAREILEILPAWVQGQDPKRVNSFLLRLVREIVVTPEGEVSVCLVGE